MSLEYIFNVMYPISDIDKFNEHDKEIEKAVGEHCSGAGTGFGERDMDFSFPDKKSAQAARKRVKALKIPGMQVATVWSYDPEKEDE